MRYRLHRLLCNCLWWCPPLQAIGRLAGKKGLAKSSDKDKPTSWDKTEHRLTDCLGHFIQQLIEEIGMPHFLDTSLYNHPVAPLLEAQRRSQYSASAQSKTFGWKHLETWKQNALDMGQGIFFRGLRVCSTPD